MRILIVDCLARGGSGRLATVDVIGVGPRLVAGILESKGLNVKIVPFEEFIKFRDERLAKYDLLLVSGMSSDEKCVGITLEKWRRVRKYAIIGGPIAFGYVEGSKDVMEDVIIVCGEGEKTVDELFNHIVDEGVEILSDVELLKNIKGLIFKTHDDIVFTGFPEHPSSTELDSYMPSTRRVKDYPQYWACRVYVEVVRGCSNFRRPSIKLPDGRKCINCSNCFKAKPLSLRLKCPLDIPAGCGYCSIPQLYGPPRSRSVNVIVKEVFELLDLGVTRIVLSAADFLDYGRDELVKPQPLTDPTWPPPNLDRIEELLSTLTAHEAFRKGKAVLSIENLKANLVDEEVARLLGKYLKGTTVHIGCETGSEKQALEIGRPVTPRDVVRAVKLLKRCGLRPYVYFIHGLPGQKIEYVKETVNIMRELEKVGVEKITTYRFTPLPLTAFSKFPRGKPYVKDKLSRMIVLEAKRINLKYKMELVNSSIPCVIVRPYYKMGKYAIGYPIYHGPVVKVENGIKYVGFKVVVKVKRVLSERLVEGVIVKVLEKVAKDVRK